jgi:hypothetical protein
LRQEAEPQTDGEQKIDGKGNEGDPPGQFCGRALGEPRDDPSADRNE